MSYNVENLKAHIISLSESSNFEAAKGEWDLVDVELHEDWDNCPCGQDIKELCHIENRRNGQRTYVGNVCINRFIGIQTGNLFQGLKRIAADGNAKPNKDLIEHAQRMGYLFEKEHGFLMSIRLKRKLTAPQLNWLKKINRRIVKKTIVRKKT